MVGHSVSSWRVGEATSRWYVEASFSLTIRARCGELTNTMQRGDGFVFALRRRAPVLSAGLRPCARGRGTRHGT